MLGNINNIHLKPLAYNNLHNWRKAAKEILTFINCIVNNIDLNLLKERFMLVG